MSQNVFSNEQLKSTSDKSEVIGIYYKYYYIIYLNYHKQYLKILIDYILFCLNLIYELFVIKKTAEFSKILRHIIYISKRINF